MAEPVTLEDVEEKVILVGVSEQDGDDAEDSLAELAELVKTAGAVVVGTLIQKRELIPPGTYVGTGKVEEIAQLIEQTGATGIVCDDELSPAQLKNLENMLGTKIMDRTLIILDIFAARATTSEGKIQVELAQLKYRLSRLTGLGRSMSRLGGGIGTRGPGEKKLEIDRRLINDRIAANVATYWVPYQMFSHTTLSESDQRIRRFLALDYTQERKGDTIKIKIDSFDTEAFFLLRLHNETVSSVKGGQNEKVEDGIYLIKASQPEVSVTVKETNEW